jgi:hypothetical protein
MATIFKVLGQVNPPANTLVTLYTVPAFNSTVIGTISVCNQSSSNSTYSIAVRPAGAAIANQHYINFNTSIPANDTITISIGITLAATDVISVSASDTSVSFMAFGSEIA